MTLKDSAILTRVLANLHAEEFTVEKQLHPAPPPAPPKVSPANCEPAVSPVVEKQADMCTRTCLNPDELDLVVHLLNARIPELRHEIHHTDAHDMRQQLRDLLVVAERLARKLTTPAGTMEPAKRSGAD